MFSMKSCKLLGKNFRIGTEVWDLNTGDSQIIEPFLSNNVYAFSFALYAVPNDFCKEQ